MNRDKAPVNRSWGVSAERSGSMIQRAEVQRRGMTVHLTQLGVLTFASALVMSAKARHRVVHVAVPFNK